MITPEVSICCITYNHAKYIRDALDGFLMQKTTFPIEIIIHDDASTDGTADIIREYEAKYPDIIKPVYQTENQYSKGVRNFLTIFPMAKGKYIAMCEGDDFWTDPKKLQIQYDFMESHPDYSLCMHGRYNLDYFNKRYYPAPYPRNFREEKIECAHYFASAVTFYTQTLFIRVSAFQVVLQDIIRDCTGAPMGDIQIVYHLALVGNVRFIPRRMATYRQAVGSAMHSESGYRKDMLQRLEMFTLKMLINSGHADWAEERIALRDKPVAISERKTLFQFLRHILGKCHFAAIKVCGRIRFWNYQLKHRKDF